MWEAIKNDPVLKSITILVLGVLSFGLAFNIMFGRNTGGMDMDGRYSLENTLAYILSISIKLLLIGLVIASIILLVKLIKKYLIEGTELKMFESIKIDKIKKDPVLKTGLIAVAVILVLSFIAIISNSPYNGYGAMGRNYYGMAANGYFLPMENAAVIFSKLLLFVSVIGLIVSFIAYARQENISTGMKKLILPKGTPDTTVQCETCNFVTDREYKFCPSCGNQRIQECVYCEAALKDGWKCCPNCGAEINRIDSETNIMENEIVQATVEKAGEDADKNHFSIEIAEAKDVANGMADKKETSVSLENDSKHQKTHEKNKGKIKE
ncbi:zinc ribbon domain-containing protein [Thermotalea metallivorans]|uniref:DZANK-type domain-containing protein n=1 Tax=Thermotalea metallivorans TaxID=520762 RepID=A0A140LBS6_9FIRM|nr:zinc ribbon domain-containing protein [Thermotalea metallivorans]KXG78001.1 hypothetical protein AN619_03110 [Thermotalea metallivorans]